MNTVIKNQNTSYADAQVYFPFKTAPVSGTINGLPIVLDQAYALTDIGAGINLQSFVGGRLYFSLGVLGPTLAHAGAYPTFQPYFDAVQAAGQSTRIAGLYSHLPTGASTTAQNYDFTTTSDASGSLRRAGGGSCYAGGATVGPGHVIVIARADLAPEVDSANPPYAVDGASAHINDNDVYPAVARDIPHRLRVGLRRQPDGRSTHRHRVQGRNGFRLPARVRVGLTKAPPLSS